MLEEIICQECQKVLKNHRALTHHILSNHSFSIKEYYDKFILDYENKCKICKKETKFINLKHGYSTYCSGRCSSKDPDILKKIIKTNKKTYENNKNEIQQKIKNTCLEKYGVEDPNQLPMFKDKIKNTKKERGVDEKECLEKRKQTNLKKYGCEHYFQSKEFEEKFNLIKKDKYGGVHPTQSEDSLN